MWLAALLYRAASNFCSLLQCRRVSSSVSCVRRCHRCGRAALQPCPTFSVSIHGGSCHRIVSGVPQRESSSSYLFVIEDAHLFLSRVKMICKSVVKHRSRSAGRDGDYSTSRPVLPSTPPQTAIAPHMTYNIGKSFPLSWPFCEALHRYQR